MPSPATPADDRRRRQRRKALVTMGIVCAGLFFAVWYAMSYIRYDNDRVSGRQPSATCRPYDPSVVTPAKTSVNVYNGGKKDGLAASVAKLLAARGFVIREVANVPDGNPVTKVGEVRYGPKGTERAKLVLAAVGQGVRGVKDNRKDTSVDLVIGTKWVKLAPSASPTGLPMCPAPSPTPTQ